MRRLKIGVDIDGVLANIVDRMLPLLARECGRRVVEDDIVCYEFTTALNISDERVAALLDELIADGHYEAAPPVTGAVQGLEALSHHQLWLVTSRPERARDQTVRWLQRHRVPFHELVFAQAGRKARNGEGFDLFVEDNLDTALALSRESIPVLLFDRPWNRQPTLPENVERVRGWGDIAIAAERWARA